MRTTTLVKNNAIVFSAFLMLALVISNTGLILFNNSILNKNTTQRNLSEQVKNVNKDIWNEIVRNMDVGLRGYAITQDTTLLSPFRKSEREKDATFNSMKAFLAQQHYEGQKGLDSLKHEVNNYQQSVRMIIDLVTKNDMEAVKEEVKKDKGKSLWVVYSRFTAQLYAYEDRLNAQAEGDYKAATNRTAYMQILLIIIGSPTLLFMIVRIRKDKQEKLALFLELEKNNRKYIFDPGTPLEVTNEKELIHHSIANFKKAAGFINQMAQGNYQVDWEELNESNKILNQSNLAGELSQMRERMKVLKAEDEKRLWATEGIAQFSEIIRSHQNLSGLSEKAIRFVIKYLKAQQGSLFVVRDEEEKYLELTACYAFDRKKFIEKRIEIGQGLVGQTYLEKQTNLLTEIPQGYIFITSGLGDAPPGCLVVVPMVHNEKVEAVIELASFTPFEAYQVEWLEKVGEIMASTMLSAKTAEKTQVLLEQFREQTEQMRAQEEELRQNMEELEATQEQMRWKEMELDRRQQQVQMDASGMESIEKI